MTLLPPLLSPLLGHWKLNTHRHPVIYIIPYIPGQPTAGGKATLSDADFKTVFWALIPSRTPLSDTFWLKKFPPVCSGISAGQNGRFWILASNYFLLYLSNSVANLAFQKEKKKKWKKKMSWMSPKEFIMLPRNYNRKIRTFELLEACGQERD